ncbi:hypothetical protein IJT93_08125 [bacterium]|nr:hypothetical protein [bacterium]
MKLYVFAAVTVGINLLFPSFSDADTSAGGSAYPKAGQRKYRSLADMHNDDRSSYPKAGEHNKPLLKTDLSKSVKAAPVESYSHGSYGQTNKVFEKEHYKVEDKTGKQNVFSDDHSKISDRLSVKPTSHSSISRTKTNLDKGIKSGITDSRSIDNINTANNRENRRKLERESEKAKSRMGGGWEALTDERLKVQERLNARGRLNIRDRVFGNKSSQNDHR